MTSSVRYITTLFPLVQKCKNPYGVAKSSTCYGWA